MLVGAQPESGLRARGSPQVRNLGTTRENAFPKNLSVAYFDSEH